MIVQCMQYHWKVQNFTTLSYTYHIQTLLEIAMFIITLVCWLNFFSLLLFLSPFPLSFSPPFLFSLSFFPLFSPLKNFSFPPGRARLTSVLALFGRWIGEPVWALKRYLSSYLNAERCQSQFLARDIAAIIWALNLLGSEYGDTISRQHLESIAKPRVYSALK